MSKASGGKDPFTIFADELTLLRNDIKQLKLSNLSYPEASVINDKITEDVTTFTMAAEKLERSVSNGFANLQQQVQQDTSRAASKAASSAITNSHQEILNAARIYSKNAGEARREAWRYFGGFWVWLSSMLLLGAVLGVLGTIFLQGMISAKEFGKYPSIYCSIAGGIVGEYESSKAKYCIFHNI